MLKNLLVFFCLLMPLNASAYSVYTTSNGAFVRWQHAEVDITLDHSLTNLGDKDSVEQVIQRAFDTWADAAVLPLEFNLEWDDCNNVDTPAQNCMLACLDRSECYNRDADKGATTYLNVAPSNGGINGVDIVFNADDWRWDTTLFSHPHCDRSNEPNDVLSLSRVATHEIGHLLGIDHSEEPESIMYPTMAQSDRRIPELHRDDIAAADVLYGDIIFSDSDDIDPSACQAVAAGRTPTGSPLPVVLIGLLVGIHFTTRRRDK